MSNQSIIEGYRKRGRPALDKEAKTLKPKGRPPKFLTEDEKKAAKKEYAKQYYKTNMDRINQNRKQLNNVKNEIINEYLELKEKGLINDAAIDIAEKEPSELDQPI